MSEITQSWFDEKLARFARGEVSLDEARELAQASLESPAWFEDLTATALAKTAVSSVPVPAAPLRHARWRSPFLLATAAAIVIGIFVVNYAMRVSSKQRDSARIASLQPPSMYGAFSDTCFCSWISATRSSCRRPTARHPGTHNAGFSRESGKLSSAATNRCNYFG
jgi:hypothetical protein